VAAFAEEYRKFKPPFPESLDERDRAGVGCCAFQACLLEQKPRDDAVDDAQHRRKQLGGAANRTRSSTRFIDLEGANPFIKHWNWSWHPCMLL